MRAREIQPIHYYVQEQAAIFLKLCSMYAVIQNSVKTSLFGQVTGPRSHNSYCQYQVTSSSHPSIVPVNISNSVSFLFLVSWQLVWNRKKLHILRPQLWGTRRSINIALSFVLKLINCSQRETLIKTGVVNQCRCYIKIMGYLGFVTMTTMLITNRAILEFLKKTYS